jgi:hypothetical protein
MKSAPRGRNTSQVEVTNVSAHGFWLFIAEEELFLPFSEFPWFKEASIAQITRVELPSTHHLYWPELDVDLAVESIRHPEHYPLVSQAQPDRRLQPTKARHRASTSTPRRRLRGSNAGR